MEYEREAEKGQPLTLTLRWQPELKEGRRKSPSTRRHERERSLQYFEKRRRMAREIDEDKMKMMKTPQTMIL